MGSNTYEIRGYTYDEQFNHGTVNTVANPMTAFWLRKI